MGRAAAFYETYHAPCNELAPVLHPPSYPHTFFLSLTIISFLPLPTQIYEQYLNPPSY